MSKICPNCLHSVRTGVNYCGYCGISLIPTPHNPTPTDRAVIKENAKAEKKSIKLAKHPKGKKIGRGWIKVPITLLVVVILAAITIRFWP